MNDKTLHAARLLQTQVKDEWSWFRGKKNAVLHLRIESDLMDRLKAEAKAHKLSLSDFVRMRLVESLSTPAPNADTPEFLSTTTAWTEAVVMHDTTCAACGEPMPRGTRAWLAHGPPPPPRMICGACQETLLTEPGETNDNPLGDE